MAEKEYPGMKLQAVLQGLQNFAPTTLAEKWDNVGLLVDPISEAPVKNILLTNDLTEEVVEEAISLNTQLIITYHPNIFEGLKSVSSRSWKERVVINCIKNQIAVFSPHTSWDAINGGINDWLAKALPIIDSVVIVPSLTDPTVGSGRKYKLSTSLTIKDAVEKIKLHIGIPHVRLALAKNKTMEDNIKSVAVCVGSGSSVLKGVWSDLYLTGEMLHHDILDATQKGIHVVLCNHSDSERGFLKEFKTILQEDILHNDVQVFVSKCDRDPLQTV